MTKNVSSLTTQVNSLNSVPDTIEFSEGGAATSNPNADQVSGWLQKKTAMRVDDDPSETLVGAQQTCPANQVMCGISFIHRAQEDYSYQEFFKIKCCDAELK
ncbi:hypothetical protein OAM67_00490 [bacterium]|nr:hypothetical protein [bacterium]